MAFRHNEAAQRGFDSAVRYLTPKGISSVEQRNIMHYIDDLTVKLGPVVDYYPTWHPLVSNHRLDIPERTPNERNGYVGLDHNVYFVSGFLSCPYHSCEEVIESVQRLKSSAAYERYSHVAEIVAEPVDKLLYHTGTAPVLVSCKWRQGVTLDKTIPKDVAIGLMLEQEVPGWRFSQLGETWEKMRPYLMGEPCGKRSSMFLDQEAGQAMKNVYEAIIYSGMFGPLKV